jgi:hypothetical protein
MSWRIDKLNFYGLHSLQTSLLAGRLAVWRAALVHTGSCVTEAFSYQWLAQRNQAAQATSNLPTVTIFRLLFFAQLINQGVRVFTVPAYTSCINGICPLPPAPA